MNPHFLDPWMPYAKIIRGGQTYSVLSRVFREDDFVSRMRFMLMFPDGKKRMLNLAATTQAIEDFNAEFGAAAHAEVVRQIVRDEVIKEIKAAAKAHSLPISPNVKLVPFDMESPVLHGVDLAKVESEMMALMFHGPLPSEAIYGPSPVAALASFAKTKAAMDDAFKEMAAKYAMNPINPAYFGKGTVVLDSLDGVLFSPSCPDIGAWSEGGNQQITPKGLATLKKFGVALAG